ncbi:hypothetical protein [Frigoriglobus tundricola]|uniref:Transmembrane protein n=1 Tax=Frigoriglobus tundricola TaxID=2774151 RepID=A0A6M5YRP1_9BACT|nr:hypothetical protein [Frigoriglobus tundricola]QJW95931.1 hypothetical protein FTUN_3485 [Frigoriglobus tundricola]
MPTAPAAPLSAPAAPAETPPPVRSLRPCGFFQRRWPVALILAAFPGVALPMAAAVLYSADNLLLWTYVWLFGMTHFVVTFALYARSENLRYFASSPGNRLVFFLVPVTLFVTFDLYHALRVGAVFPLIGVFVLAAVRLADFNHFNRQSFGVLQLFKARTGVKTAPATKRVENLYFLSLTGLLYVTFLAGGRCPLIQPGGALTVAPFAGDSYFPALLPLSAVQVVWAGWAVVATGLFGAVLAGLWKAAGAHNGFGAAVAYVLVQTAAALMAAVYFPLYLAALAVHYVEYHVLMAPRCFRAALDPASRLDRVYGAVRSQPVAFYLLVLAVAGLVTLGARAGMGMMGHDPGDAGRSFEYLALIAVFDGLFVFHYFVEMFVWRFGNAHFRRELSGLYFAAGK